MQPRKLGWMLRGAAVAIVFGLGFFAFHCGVGVTDRLALPTASVFAHLYYAAGLFVLGGMDLGTPVGGPAFARHLLWFAYFAAPLITTGAVVEGAFRLVGRSSFERLGLKNHIVVAGLGKLGTDFVLALRSWDKARTVVALNRDAGRAGAAQARRHLGVRLFSVDIKLKTAFSSLAMRRALGVALLTDNDLLNLEVAFRLAQEFPKLRVVAHVSDIALQRAVADLEQRADQKRVFIFNAHRIAAEHLYDNHLRSYFLETEAKDTVVVAGFGRFGQSIVESLESQAGSDLAKVIVVDRTASLSLRTFRTQVPIERSIDPVAIDGDLQDPEIWNEIDVALGTPETPPVIVIGCDDDRVNLRSAMYARRRWPKARIFVRCQSESSFTGELGARCDFTTLSVDAVVIDSLTVAQKKWFS